MALDMRPFSVVKNEGFKYLLSVLEPRYLLPSRAHFSQNVLPKLQEKTKAKVEEGLSRLLLNPSQSPQMDGRPVPQTAT